MISARDFYGRNYGLPSWLEIVSMMGLGLIGLGFEVFVAVRHVRARVRS